MRKELGKITSVRVGMGGYQNVQMGVWVGLGGKGWGVGDGKGTWASRPDSAKWSVEEQVTCYGEAMAWLRDLMKQAGVDEAHKLVGVPIEATFDSTRLESWRILDEVL